MKSLTILVIDDNIYISQILKINFKKNNDYNFNIISAFNGEDGILKLKSEKIDIVILDLALPILDGKQILKFIKNDNILKELAVIILTGTEDKNIEKELLNLKADYFLTKPFTVKEIEKIIYDLIEKKIEAQRHPQN